MNNWQSMLEHKFPWHHRDIIIAAYVKDEPEIIEVHRCNCGEHGALFFKNEGMLSVIEMGWVPFAWRIDDIPSLYNLDFPPMLTDYLTEGAKND